MDLKNFENRLFVEDLILAEFQFPEGKGILRVENGKFFNLIHKFGDDSLKTLFHRVFQIMVRDRECRFFFLMNPKQISVAEPKILIKKGEVNPEDFAIYSIESGLLLSLESECAEEKLTEVMKIFTPSGSRILNNYLAVIKSIAQGLSKLYGQDLTIYQASSKVSEVAGKVGEEIFKPVEYGVFCIDCGIYTVSPKNPVIANSCLVKNHCLIKTTVYKLNEVFLIAWEEGMMLEGYVAQVLIDSGWNTLFSVEVHGLEGGRHEVDVIAEKDDNYLIIECKHVAPYNWVLYDDAIKSIGKMALIEETISKAYQRRKEEPRKIIKAIITTGEATKSRETNVMISNIKDFLIAPKEDTLNGLSEFKKNLKNLLD
jgi:Holliday junction resolvase